MNNAEHADAESRTESTDRACSIDTDNETDDDQDRSHLDGINDGCGCTEIWEHLSEQRDE